MTIRSTYASLGELQPITAPSPTADTRYRSGLFVLGSMFRFLPFLDVSGMVAARGHLATERSAGQGQVRHAPKRGEEWVDRRRVHATAAARRKPCEQHGRPFRLYSIGGK